MINNPLMDKPHYDQGAYHPYLPAHSSASSQVSPSSPSWTKKASKTSWKYIDYPYWSGPAEEALHWKDEANTTSPLWLRLQNSTGEELLRTPIRDIEYNSWGPGLLSWSIAAQSHFSLLENLLDNQLHLYYHDIDPVWLTDGNRLSIAMIAINSNDMLDNFPMDECDEVWLTLNLPHRLGRHVGVDTRALAAHFTHWYQRDMERTDLLDRYANYASDNICRNPP